MYSWLWWASLQGSPTSWVAEVNFGSNILMTACQQALSLGVVRCKWIPMGGWTFLCPRWCCDEFPEWNLKLCDVEVLHAALTDFPNLFSWWFSQLRRRRWHAKQHLCVMINEWCQLPTGCDVFIVVFCPRLVSHTAVHVFDCISSSMGDVNSQSHHLGLGAWRSW